MECQNNTRRKSSPTPSDTLFRRRPQQNIKQRDTIDAEGMISRDAQAAKHGLVFEATCACLPLLRSCA